MKRNNDSREEPADAPPVLAPKVRIAKYLASAGIAARRECEEYVRLGRVTINGEIVTDLTRRVEPDRDDIRFDDERVKPEPKVYWWINKPKGVLCTSKDTHGRRTILDLLPKMRNRVYAVGRLDEDSTGLLLATNDGEMALRLTHPRYGVPKTYLALVAGKLEPAIINKLLAGVWLSDGRAKAHSIVRMGSQGNATRIKIVLKEGRNREIRRMFAKFGHKVMSLHRTAIGPLKIRRLSIGEVRKADAEEIFELRKLAGLAKGVPSRPLEPRPGRRPPGRPPGRPAASRSATGSRFASKKSAPAGIKKKRPTRKPKGVKGAGSIHFDKKRGSRKK